MHTISCIIPTYDLDSSMNWDRFCILLDSLARAAKRLIPDHYEIIVVNDDPQCERMREVGQLLLELGLSECTKILFNEHNMGQAYSRNKGGDEAKNEYLHFIDQDDYIGGTFYDAMDDVTAKDVYIACPVFFIENQNREKPAISLLTRIMYERALCLHDIWPLLFSNIAYSPGQVVIRKAKFLEAGCFPALRNRGSDDYGLFFNLTFHTHTSVSYMKNARFYYRIHGNQNSKILNMSDSINEFFESFSSDSFRESVIKNMKTSVLFRLLAKLIYIFFFKRAPRSNSR
jgi:glycosyltransferase involved in cell wall biosynthesis